MGMIYLVNILHKILIYSKYTLNSVTIISRPFMVIFGNNIMAIYGNFEYTCNMVVHIHSKYTSINYNTSNYIL
jgi:hypothetical protein